MKIMSRINSKIYNCPVSIYCVGGENHLRGGRREERGRGGRDGGGREGGRDNKSHRDTTNYSRKVVNMPCVITFHRLSLLVPIPLFFLSSSLPLVPLFLSSSSSSSSSCYSLPLFLLLLSSSLHLRPLLPLLPLLRGM